MDPAKPELRSTEEENWTPFPNPEWKYEARDSTSEMLNVMTVILTKAMAETKTAE